MTTMMSTFMVKIPTGGSIKERIIAGKYGWSHPDIDDGRFELTLPEGEHEVVLFQPQRALLGHSAIQMMAEAGLEPALIDHGLAFGEQYPEIQKTCEVVILGSSARCTTEESDVLVLDCHVCLGGKRGLGLKYFGGGFGVRHGFLAIRKRERKEVA